MYSPTQQDFFDSGDQYAPSGLASLGTPHTTVGAVPVSRNNRSSSSILNPTPSSSYQHHHQRQGSSSFSMGAMSPPSAGLAAHVPGARPISFGDPNAQNWFGTSLDSTGSSFGQSPIFGSGRDLMVSPSTSTGHLDGASMLNEDDEIQQQRNLQEMFEKRRRRRESHNAVERRRRDNINERIQELCSLLPDHLLESVPASANVMAMSSGHSPAGAGGGGGGTTKAINKGTILKLSVEHIKELRDKVNHYKERVQELERLIEAAKRGEPVSDQDLKPSTSPPTGDRRHERTGSVQFQQQFGNLHIKDPQEP